MTAHQIYDESVRAMPAAERLQLATLILNDIPPQSVGDYSENWSDEDIQDATLHSFRNAAASFGEGEDVADA